jgi:hypothetical protein
MFGEGGNMKEGTELDCLLSKNMNPSTLIMVTKLVCFYHMLPYKTLHFKVKYV